MKEIYQFTALELAPKLLGCELCTRSQSGELSSGIIVETEAYAGKDDAASHAFRGPTPRSKIMFEKGGIAYVYFTYGTHHCVNIVAGAKGDAGAVLIRALEPLRGIELMKLRRNKESLLHLCSGPGKLTQALGIDLSHNSESLSSKRIWLKKRIIKDLQIQSGPRIG